MLFQSYKFGQVMTSKKNYKKRTQIDVPPQQKYSHK